MQYDAYEILTAIPQGGSSSNPNNLVPQYIIPVKRSTARPDGNVIHKVQYGQSLWSIAVTYNTTIDQIRAWNNLGDSIEIYDGQVLLVQMKATQPPPPTSTPQASPTSFFMTATPTATGNSPTITVQPSDTKSDENGEVSSSGTPPGLWAGIIVVLALVAGAFGTWVSTTRSAR
jgi:LysM repeat protein